ncbi:ROK family transcriptional regulator [Luteipulveratus mongoliensis]|uniref:ArsR family transcriptional regulator n=1 Tax=Luteipulveratus mongoliensis TaxID=571913 RepID=A0A0K1JMT7_9MICO|nr:ROK family transcriptional regulator [Luteipulveratus mongoliensis]AKU18021.1 ArsR family transcriptional regulator [Luteipulveratus mongoliensis]
MTSPPPSGPGRPGSQTALRRRNRQTVVHALLANGPATQAELARQTGLSNATVSNIVKELAQEGLAVTEPTTSSGRRALSVRLQGTRAVAAGFDVGRRHLRVVLATVGYEVLAEDAIALPIGHSAEDGLDAAAAMLDKLVDKAGIERRAVIGAGVGLPGPIERERGTVLDGAILPAWIGTNVPKAFGERLGLEVLVDNDANLGAMAEIAWGERQDATELIFVKVGTGIGAGLVIGGKLHYGALGTAGEIGHTTVDPQGPFCRCGNRGCLETLASTSTMIESLAPSTTGPVSTADIVRRGLEGDSATLRVIDDAGFVLGRVMASLANFVNPQVIVVGGPLAALGDAFLDPIRRGLVRHAVPVVGETTQIVVSSLGDRAEALGAASLVLQHAGLNSSLRSLLDDKAVDGLTARHV